MGIFLQSGVWPFEYGAGSDRFGRMVYPLVGLSHERYGMHYRCVLYLFCGVLFDSIDKIPNTYQEAASIDGATDLVCFFKITLPLLRDVLVISISLWIINAIKYFELIWAMFKGKSTMLNTLGTYMFTMAFGVDVPVFKLGYGSAIAVVMFLMVALFVGGFRKIFDREDLQY